MITHASTRSALIGALLAASLAATFLLPPPAAAAPATASAPAAHIHAPRASAPAAASSSTASPATPAASDTDADVQSDADSTTQDSDDTGTDTDDGNWNGYDGHGFRFRHRPHHGNDLVSVGHDSTLSADGQRDSVVSVFGSSSNYGTAHHDVVSVFGNTTVTGPTEGSAVAVLGNTSVNADVGQDVVAVLGNVTLGPKAHVHGHVVSIMGTVNEDPAAIVDDGVDRVLPGEFGTAQGLRTWVGHGLMLGRPLIFGSGLWWLWGFSFALLAVYVIIALLFRDATSHCIASLNDNPGKSFVTAIVAMLLTPLLMLLLAITLVGIPVIPILLLTLILAGVFGKTTVLGWIGSRCLGMRPGQTAVHPALAVLMGGILVMLLYLVPLLGFLAFILLSTIGYGAVLYALLNRIRRSTSGSARPRAAAAATGAPAAFAAEPVMESRPSAAASDPAPHLAPAAAAADAPGAQGAAVPPPDAAPAVEPVGTPLPLSTLPRPGFWVRIGALFIDAVIIAVLIPVLLGETGYAGHRLFLLGLALYGALMWKFKGTTIGGIVFDLRVVRLDSRPLDWPTVCVRALGCILSLCALGLGFFWIGIDPGKQAWHDKLAGTIVVRVPRGTPLV